MLSRLPLQILALAAVVVGCARQAPVDTDAARTTLREADAQYTKAALGKDRAAFVGFYAADAVMYPPGESTATGLDAVGNVADAFWRDPAFGGSFRPIVVGVSADGTMGYTLNAAELSVTGSDGKPATERLRDFHLWHRRADGSWKLVMDIWNSERAPTRQ